MQLAPGAESGQAMKRTPLKTDSEKTRAWKERSARKLRRKKRLRTRSVQNKRRRQYAAFMASKEWREQRARIIARDESTCRYCGEYTDRPEAHHTAYSEPIESTSDSDIVCACSDCHRAITEGRFSPCG